MSVIGFSVSQQAAAISQACATYQVPLQVFMGMYNNETTLGTNVNSSGGGVGPFQFQTGTGNFSTYGYPQTNTPTLQEFQQQALGAAHLLNNLYNQLGHSWTNALAGYNGGAGGYRLPVTQAYAAKALAFKIPADWSAALGKGPGAAGGVAGAGGTGAGINDVAQFQVGDTSVPDEDFWTCMNRLAQARYWYLFSDAEIVYLADGPDLMNQEPVADLNRLAHLDRISHLDFTWDNCCSVILPIPTPDGWTTMGDLRAGDYVFGSNGWPTRVLRTSAVHLNRNCYRVIFDDHTSIVTDADHRWETRTRDGVDAIHTTAEIGSSLKVNTSLNHRVKLVEPLQLPEADLLLDPYVLGYILGDGSAGSAVISVGADDVSSLTTQIEAAGYGHYTREKEGTGFATRSYYRVSPKILTERVTGGPCATKDCVRPVRGRGLCGTCLARYTYQGKQLPPKRQDGIGTRLRKLGLEYEKFIPNIYLRASFPQRLALLQGLMDSDGTIGSGGSSPSFSSTDERLARGVLELIRSLGFRPNWSGPKPPKNGGRKLLYTVSFAPQSHLNPFRLLRKAERYAGRVATRRWASYGRAIVAVKPVPSVPVRCITVEAEDHLFVAGEGMTLTRNTAWRYVATHHRRAHIQRKSRLAKITSPVMANLNLISDIDEMRSGDVFRLSGCGPGDGRWLVGTTRRSIFQVISEIELVPALQPLSEQALQSGVAGVGQASSRGAIPVGSASVQKVQRAINAVLGAPYTGPSNHAGAINQQPGTIKHLGTDCSGFISYLMGPSGLGIWTTAYATPAIPSAPSIQPGPGQSITLYNNPLPGNSGHVFITINGTSYEEGGSAHSCHQMTASETQYYVKSGAFTALHPAGY